MRLILPCLFLCACAGSPLVDAGTAPRDASTEPSHDAGDPLDAGDAPDASAPLDAGTKADDCASTFSTLFTDAFGRADGIVTAVVLPGVHCPLENADHLVIQISIDGGIQRLVVNVKSDFGDPRVRSLPLDAPLPAPAWEPGWHPGLTFDFPTNLGVHADAGWDLLDLEPAAQRVYDAVEVGAPISIYGTSSGHPDSAHKIHRNGHGDDGAIVLDPLGPSPHWLLFSFQTQTF